MTISQYLSEEEFRALLQEEVDMSHQGTPTDSSGKTLMMDSHLLLILKATLENLVGRVAYLETEVNCLRLELAVSNQLTWPSLDSNESLLLETSTASEEQAANKTTLAPRSERYPKKSKGIWEKLFH